MGEIRVIAVASQKGGVGKTTTAVNLGDALAASGRRVVLIDLDPQGNATSGLGLKAGDPSLLDAAETGKPLVELARETEWHGLRLIPASRRLADIDLQQRILRSGLSGLRSSIRELGGDAEFVLIDCPPSLGVLPHLGIAASGSVLVPIQCEYFAMEGLSKTLPEIERARRDCRAHIAVEGLLLTMFSPEVDLCVEVASEVRGHFPELVYGTVVPRDVLLAEAASHGKPVLEYAPASRGAWAYVRLAREILHDGT